MFQCGNGECISISLYCDFVDHCTDGSDEQKCGKLLHKTQEQYKQ